MIFRTEFPLANTTLANISTETIRDFAKGSAKKRGYVIRRLDTKLQENVYCT